jgi:hypothetical protein
MAFAPNSSNYAENARVALDLWRSLEGQNLANLQGDPVAAQKALKRYVQCFKAVIGEDFDLSTIT